MVELWIGFWMVTVIVAVLAIIGYEVERCFQYLWLFTIMILHHMKRLLVK